jgi:hypothetical protein
MPLTEVGRARELGPIEVRIAAELGSLEQRLTREARALEMHSAVDESGVLEIGARDASGPSVAACAPEETSEHPGADIDIPGDQGRTMLQAVGGFAMLGVA